MRLFKQLAAVLATLVLLGGIITLFSFDIVKIQWVSFMGIQPSFKPMENPLPVPARSIPVEGPSNIPNIGAPANPVPADATSIARGAELFRLNCSICHGLSGEGNGSVAAFFLNKKPANLTSPTIQFLSDRAIFMVITNGFGFMPPLNENLLMRERWDVVNYVRTLKK